MSKTPKQENHRKQNKDVEKIKNHIHRNPTMPICNGSECTQDTKYFEW